MRRLHEMRLIKLDRYEYQLIGEIVVLSGMLEQHLKEVIVRLVRAPWTDGLALVAHQNFGSLCDIALALLPATVPSQQLQRSFRSAIKDAKKFYDDRNKIVHGPFSPWVTVVTGKTKSTLRFMARGKLTYQGYTFNRDSLKETLKGLTDVYEALFGCMLLLEEERGESDLSFLRSRSRRAAQKANPQTRARLPRSSRA